MQPILEKIHKRLDNSFSFKEDIIPYISIPWHYHPELEVTLFTEGKGRRYVGDHIENFDGLELVMLGGNLPHCWKNYPEYYQGEQGIEKNRALVIHFNESSFGKGFFDLPEMHSISSLIRESHRGIKFVGSTLEKGREIFEKININSGFDRLVLFFKLLRLLSTSDEKKILASMGYRNVLTNNNLGLIEKVYQYTTEQYLKDVALSQVADHVNMTVPSFSRFFKKHTGKTYSRFVNEMRIGYACRLLIDTDYNITQICYEVGFNNESYFFRVFKKITGSSPQGYKENSIRGRG